MNRLLSVLAFCGLGLSLSGCWGAAQAPTSTAAVEINDVRAVVAPSAEAGDQVATVTILAPSGPAYRLLADKHKWVANDIFEYRVTLKVFQNNAWEDLAPTLTITVPQKGTPKSRAVFTKLKQGSHYRAEVYAWGNVDGTAASTQLNTVPGLAEFDFSAVQNVQDTYNRTVLITFDQVDFSGTGDVTFQTPSDGTFKNPATGESVSVQ